MIKLKEVIKNKSQWIELNTYIELIENNQDENPNIALDGAKSLLETVSKTILEDKYLTLLPEYYLRPYEPNYIDLDSLKKEIKIIDNMIKDLI